MVVLREQLMRMAFTLVLTCRNFWKGCLAVALGGLLSKENAYGMQYETTFSINNLQQVTQLAGETVAHLAGETVARVRARWIARLLSLASALTFFRQVPAPRHSVSGESTWGLSSAWNLCRMCVRGIESRVSLDKRKKISCRV